MTLALSHHMPAIAKELRCGGASLYCALEREA